MPEQRQRGQPTSSLSDAETSKPATEVPAGAAFARSGLQSYLPLPPPPSIFVYSFYDDDKPENFFRHLQIWLEGTSAPDKQKSPTQLMFDIQQHQGLIILDGLEKVQESGARGGFGRLTSPSLRDLLNHIACGSARELSVLVTSRFPLTDLRDSQPRFFTRSPSTRSTWRLASPCCETAASAAPTCNSPRSSSTAAGTR